MIYLEYIYNGGFMDGNLYAKSQVKEQMKALAEVNIAT
jgi:hypothetical protein